MRSERERGGGGC